MEVAISGYSREKLPNWEENDPVRSERVLYNIVSEPVSSVALIIQEMADETIESAKEYLRNLIDSQEKKEKLKNLEYQIDKRSDLSKETLSKCVKDQLDILVAVRTGLKYFLSGEFRIPMDQLVEIFLFLRCRNVNCKSLLPVDDCICKICSNNRGFCSSCMCMVCLIFDSASNSCSWVGCDVCSHWCHAACGIQKNLIKPGHSLKGPRGTTEMMFHCIGCACKSEMFGFVKSVFVSCAANWRLKTLLMELDCVRKVFQGSGDAKGKALHLKANEMVQKLESQEISPLDAPNFIIQFFNSETSYRKDEAYVTPSTSKDQKKKRFAFQKKADEAMELKDPCAVMLDFHEHLVYPTKLNYSTCDVCCNFGEIDCREERDGGEGGYTCLPCGLYVHKDCVEINNLSRHRHPLKLISLQESGKKCSLCEQILDIMFYHCIICDFRLCTLCSTKSLVIDVPKKVHKHSLTQVMIEVSFTCHACGVYDHGFSCLCLQCCFIIHKDCVKLPRVIHINRHDHRVSHTYLLGHGDWICGVCRKEIDRLYGCYSCSICHYAVHSKCATRHDVWDGVELENVHEDENQDPDPFEVISERLIKHFSHEHDLRLVNSGSNDHCDACILPIYDDPYYTCTQCRFILHETCASFPRTKRHELHQKQFTLYPNSKSGDEFPSCTTFFDCYACNRPSTGFRYDCGGIQLDVRCARISDKFLHGSHPHSLSITSLLPQICSVCDVLVDCILTCVECSYFYLCFKCATIPNEAIHKYDKHTLYLRYSGDPNHSNWCEICEQPTNPENWFYSCDKCGSTFHIDCVLGITPYVKPGHRFLLSGYEFQVVYNNHICRPFCGRCSLRCVDVIVLKLMNETETLCSINCLMSFVFGSIYTNI